MSDGGWIIFWVEWILWLEIVSIDVSVELIASLNLNGFSREENIDLTKFFYI